jgi:hypothetical protein
MEMVFAFPCSNKVLFLIPKNQFSRKRKEEEKKREMCGARGGEGEGLTIFKKLQKKSFKITSTT